MTGKTDEKVVDLVGLTRPDQQTVANRIKRRKAVLAEWLKDGIPAGKRRNLPASLRAARDWDDPELGIVRIGSPNEFTQKHPLHGEDVREIARMLTEITRRYGRPDRGRNKPAKAPAATFDKKESERQLAQAVSQWHAERNARLSAQNQADAAERRARIVLEENAELRRKLATYQGPTIIS
jgi:hypothetical protein